MTDFQTKKTFFGALNVQTRKHFFLPLYLLVKSKTRMKLACLVLIK